MHDYAYSVALKALEEQDMLLEVGDWNCDALPLPDNAFILVKAMLQLLISA